MDDPKTTVTDTELRELIEDSVLTEVLRERLEEEVEPWEDVEGDGWGDLT